MSLQQRLAKLEQARTDDAGAGIYGVRRVHWQTGIGPEVVTIPQTGERMTLGAFEERYPRGLIILSAWYGDEPPTGDEAA